MQPSRSLQIWAVFAALALVVLINNWSISLWDQDEAAYAGFAYNMIKSGNWLIPEFMWGEVHRKPPLHFWMIAGSYKLFGVSEFSVRLPASLSIIGTYLLVLFQGRKHFGGPIAFWGMAVLGTSFLVPALGKMAVTDGLLLFLSTLCGFSVLNVLRDRSWKWAVVFWASFSLALLTKGPPILIFSAVFLALLFAVHPKRVNLLRLHPWFGLPLASAPLVLWAYLTTRVDGGALLSWLLDFYVLRRVSASAPGETGPPGYYLVSFLIFFLPYLVFVPTAIGRTFSAFKTKEHDLIVLGSWLAAGWLLWELSPSKLPVYAVVAHVPLALLIGRCIVELNVDQRAGRGLKIATNFHSIVAVGFGIGLMTLPLVLPELGLPVAALVLVGSVWLIGTAIASVLFWKGRYQRFTYALAATAWLFALGAWGVLLPQLEPLRNGTKRVALYLDQTVAPATEVLIANGQGHPPSLPFYLLTHFDDVKENYDRDELIASMRSTAPVALILSQELAEEIRAIEPDWRMERITSLHTDRVGAAVYYITYNEAAAN